MSFLVRGVSSFLGWAFLRFRAKNFPLILLPKHVDIYRAGGMKKTPRRGGELLQAGCNYSISRILVGL